MKISKDILQSLKYGTLQHIPETFNTASVIDSRQLKPGMLFFALKGENTDGHNYVERSQEKKPAFCVVEEQWVDKQTGNIQNLPLWIVKNSEKALQLLARKIREITNIPVLALTGTNGKTSTRSMITEVLSKKFNVLATIGNLNNHLGLPLSLLRIEEHHNFAVLEMGTNHFGEIELLCNIAKPNYGLITNIGRGHTEFLESPAGVAKAKSELFNSLPKEGIVFINADDHYIPAMTSPAETRITYSMKSETTDHSGKIETIDKLGCATLVADGKTTIKLKIPGVYQAFNALVAYTVGHHFGIAQDQIKTALEEYSGVPNRLGIKKKRCTVIDDTYNANPESTLGAVKTLADLKTAGKKYFILGDMLELGENKELYHTEIGEQIAQTDIDYLYCHGQLSYYTIAGAKKAGHTRAVHFLTKQEIIDLLNKNLTSDDVVLLKGSRGSKMEEIIEGMKE